MFSTYQIRAEELSRENSNIDFKFSAVGLDKKVSGVSVG